MTNTCTQNYKFEGKERDTETGNDDFGARYYASRTGRWLSAAERAPRSPVNGASQVPGKGSLGDRRAWEISRAREIGTRSGSAAPASVPYANLTNPQTLNLYAMVSDNPETFADLDGHCSMDQEVCDTNPSNGETANQASTNKNVCNNETGKCDNANANVNGHDQDKVQNQVTILGNSVAITYASGLSPAARVAASNAIAAAAGLINKNAGALTADEKKAIGQISSFSVVGSHSYLGATGGHAMALSVKYIKGSSSAWIGSLFGHEGQHYLNAGKYSGPNLWKDEQSAGRMQLSIGEELGFTANERKGLEMWIDDKNRAAMQRHMEQGYKY